MNCPKCGSDMGRNRRYCDRCGTDTAVMMRLYRLSNRYYNEGLTRAKVRDLSGAVLMLRKSLEHNKRNIDARNLIGLVYYEMGEPITALSEWIISKHFQPENNDADYFIDKVQSNPAKLDAVNQTVKKYNQALAYAKQGSDDLAMLQLRKAIGVRPGYVKALQLLALLYMKSEEYEKARRCLLRAQKIDVANTITLSYLAEIENILNPEGQPVRAEKETEGISYQPISTGVSFKEDKPNYMAFVTFFAGILIGICVLYLLVVPTIRSDAKEQYAKKERDYGAEIASYSATISVLNDEIATLKDELEVAENKIKRLQQENESIPIFDSEAFEQAMFVLMEYSDLEDKILQAEEEPEDGKTDEDAKQEELKELLDDLIVYAKKLRDHKDGAALMSAAERRYKEIEAQIVGRIKLYGYDIGHELYNDGEYEEAIPYFLAVCEACDEDADTLYFLARSYQRSGDTANAGVYYTQLFTEYPDSDRAEMAHQVWSE